MRWQGESLENVVHTDLEDRRGYPEELYQRRHRSRPSRPRADPEGKRPPEDDYPSDNYDDDDEQSSYYPDGSTVPRYRMGNNEPVLERTVIDNNMPMMPAPPRTALNTDYRAMAKQLYHHRQQQKYGTATINNEDFQGEIRDSVTGVRQTAQPVISPRSTVATRQSHAFIEPVISPRSTVATRKSHAFIEPVISPRSSVSTRQSHAFTEPMSEASETTVSSSSSYHPKPVGKLVKRYEKKNLKLRKAHPGSVATNLPIDSAQPSHFAAIPSTQSARHKPMVFTERVASPARSTSNYSQNRHGSLKTMEDEYLEGSVAKQLGVFMPDEAPLSQQQVTVKREDVPPQRRHDQPPRPSPRMMFANQQEPLNNDSHSVGHDPSSSASSSALHKNHHRKGAGFWARVTEATSSNVDQAPLVQPTEQDTELVSAEEFGLVVSPTAGRRWVDHHGPMVGKEVVTGEDTGLVVSLPSTIRSIRSESTNCSRASSKPIVSSRAENTRQNSRDNHCSVTDAREGRDDQSSVADWDDRERYAPAIDAYGGDAGGRYGLRNSAASRDSFNPQWASSKEFQVLEMGSLQSAKAGTGSSGGSALNASRCSSRTRANVSSQPSSVTLTLDGGSRDEITITPTLPIMTRQQPSVSKGLQPDDLERLRSGKAGTRMVCTTSDSSFSSSVQASRGSARTPLSFRSHSTLMTMPMNNATYVLADTGDESLFAATENKDIQSGIGENVIRAPLLSTPVSRGKHHPASSNERQSIQSIDRGHGPTMRIPRPEPSSEVKSIKSVKVVGGTEIGVDKVLGARENTDAGRSKKFSVGAQEATWDQAHVANDAMPKKSTRGPSIAKMIKKVVQRLPSPKRRNQAGTSAEAGRGIDTATEKLSKNQVKPEQAAPTRFIESSQREGVRRLSPVLVQTVQSRSESESSAGNEIAHINSMVPEPSYTQVGRAVSPQSVSAKTSSSDTHQATEQAENKSASGASPWSESEKSTPECAVKSENKTTLLEDIIQKLDGEISLLHALLRQGQNQSSEVATYEKADGEQEAAGESGFFRGLWRTSRKEAPQLPTKSMPPSDPAPPLPNNPPSDVEVDPPIAEQLRPSTDGTVLPLPLKDGRTPSSIANILRPDDVEPSSPTTPSLIPKPALEEKKEVRFSSEQPMVREISMDAGSMLSIESVDKKVTRPSRKARKMKKYSEKRGGIFAFVQRRNGNGKTRKKLVRRTLVASKSDDLSEDSESSRDSEVAEQEEPSVRRAEIERTRRQPEQKKHTRRVSSGAIHLKKVPKKEASEIIDQPPRVVVRSPRGPPLPFIRNTSDTVKSPVHRRREKEAGYVPAHPKTTSFIRDTAKLLTLSSDDSEIAMPVTGISSVETEPSLQIIDSALEVSNRQVNNNSNPPAGDFISWLFPGVFCMQTPQAASALKQSESQTQAESAIVPEDFSTTVSNTKRHFIPHVQWHDILNITETLAIQYREAEKMANSDVSASERTIAEVNLALSKFKKHAKQLGVHERQLMEAIRDDVRDLHEIKAKRPTQIFGNDKFLGMYEYYFSQR